MLTVTQAGARVVAASMEYTAATMKVMAHPEKPRKSHLQAQVTAYSKLSSAQWELEKVLRAHGSKIPPA